MALCVELRPKSKIGYETHHVEILKQKEFVCSPHGTNHLLESRALILIVFFLFSYDRSQVDSM